MASVFASVCLYNKDTPSEPARPMLVAAKTRLSMRARCDSAGQSCRAAFPAARAAPFVPLMLRQASAEGYNTLNTKVSCAQPRCTSLPTSATAPSLKQMCEHPTHRFSILSRNMVPVCMQHCHFLHASTDTSVNAAMQISCHTLPQARALFASRCCPTCSLMQPSLMAVVHHAQWDGAWSTCAPMRAGTRACSTAGSTAR